MRKMGSSYQPGLLMNTIIAWNVVKFVPKYSSVALLCNSTETMLYQILLQMLATKSDTNVCRIDGSPNLVVIISSDCVRNLVDVLRNTKYIIGVNSVIPEYLEESLYDNGAVTIKTIDTKKVLSQISVETDLKLAVRWIRKHGSSIKVNTTDSVLNLSHNESCNLSYKVPSSQTFQKTGVYIITGGLTGLGWVLLSLIAEMGAGTIVTFSRRLPSDDRLAEIRDIEEKFSCKIIAIQVDVNNFDAVTDAISKLRLGPGRISGVFHGAGVLDSKLLIYMTEENLDKVMKPKIQGSMNLHIATLGLDLDFFMVHSSITSIVGDPGQSNYGAANTFLDTFAVWRRQIGLAGQAINWGALEIGMAANNDFDVMFARRGYQFVSTPEIRSCFHQAIMQNATYVIYANLDWNAVSKDYATGPMHRLRLRMNDIIEEKATRRWQEGDGDSNLSFDVAALRKASPEAQMDACISLVYVIANSVFGKHMEKHYKSATFEELGMDSLSAVTFSNAIYDLTSLRIHIKFMMDQSKMLVDVAEYVMINLFDSKLVTEKQEAITEL